MPDKNDETIKPGQALLKKILNRTAVLNATRHIKESKAKFARI